MYNELVMTSKEYMQCVTSVDPHWLAEMGPMFFSVKESGFNRLEKRKFEKTSAKLMEEELEKDTEKRRALEQEETVATPSRHKIATPGFRAPTPRTGGRREPSTPKSFLGM